jgi:hypothetical protein
MVEMLLQIEVLAEAEEQAQRHHPLLVVLVAMVLQE